jgi:uncharacterized protein YegP (UPF0339 family)
MAMRKLAVCALMLALMAGITGTSTSGLLAQPPKKDKDTKKDAKKGKGGSLAGTIEITEGKDGKYRFNVRNADGKYLGGSGPTGYASEKEAEKAIEEFKEVVANAKVTKAKPRDK